jgi:hypothetical protein
MLRVVSRGRVGADAPLSDAAVSERAKALVAQMSRRDSRHHLAVPIRLARRCRCRRERQTAGHIARGELRNGIAVKTLQVKILGNAVHGQDYSFA